jgi:hypothetical protein
VTIRPECPAETTRPFRVAIWEDIPCESAPSVRVMTQGGIFRLLVSTICILALGFVGLATDMPSAAANHRPLTGTISGIFQEVGGPAPGNPRPLAGVVDLTNTTGKHVFFKTGKDGSVTGRIAAGTYMATGRSPKVESNGLVCESRVPVVIHAGHRAHFTVACDVP